MFRKHARMVASFLGMAFMLALFLPKLALADDGDDPPSVVARLAYTQGSVSFQPGGTDDWVTAVLNRPVTTGDKLWSDTDGRVELQLDASTIRLSNNTGFSFLNLDDNITQIRLTEGTVLVRVRQLDDNETYEVDTPNLAFSITAPGVYRVSVDENGASTAIRVRDGQGQVTGGGTSYSVRANDDAVFEGTDQLSADVQDATGDSDDFDSWSDSRDQHYQHSKSAEYVSQDVVGYEDLDDHGDWDDSPDYGHVWYPRVEQTDWAPYHYGHWAYIEPWGYTWVDDEPWGFAPFHYGRWVSVRGRWGWIPAPRRVVGVAYVRPVYAPALVAFVGGGGFSVGVSVGGGGGAVGWFALGPREVYVPSYRVSQRYVERVNVSNTRVTTTVVNNYYNTTVINNRVSNVTYVNQRVPGAVVATNREAFSSGRAIQRNTVKFDQRQIASARVQVRQPTIVPTRQAVLGTGRAEAKQPPASLQTRAVVARRAPPAPLPSFEKRQEAIKSNGGKPLTKAEIRQIQPAPAAQAHATVRVAPPPKQPAVSVRQAPKPAEPINRTPAQGGVRGNVGNRPGQPGQSQNANPGNRPAAPNTVQPNAAQPNSAQPGNRPNERPNDRQVTPPNAAQPGNRPADRPVTQPNAAQPGNRPNERPNDRQVTPPKAAQPGNRPADRTDRPNATPNNRPADRPADRQTERPAPTPIPADRQTERPAPAPRPADRPADRQTERPAPAPRPADRPADRQTERPAPAPRPADRPADRQTERPAPAPRPADRPADRQTERPAPTPTPADRPADRSTDRPNARPDNRQTERPAPTPRPADRPAPKPADRPVDRPADRPAARPAERPAPPADRPATRQQEKDKAAKDKEKPPKDKEKDKPRS